MSSNASKLINYPVSLEDIIREREKRFLESSLIEYVKWSFRNKTKKEFIVNHHHVTICEYLEKVFRHEITRLIINIPPRYSKTEIAVKCFIEWCLAKVPESRFIHLSYSDSLALDNSSEIREDIKSDWYQYYWNRKTKQDSDSKQKWYTEDSGGLYATGTAGSITGFGAGGSDDNFCGAVLIDDPQKPSEAFSPEIRRKINDRLNNTIMSRLNNPRKTPIIIIMQRLHEDDMSGFCLNDGTGEKWVHLCLPVLNELDEPLWPLKHDYEQIMRIKKSSRNTFNGQYMQKPLPDEGVFFSKKDFEIVDTLPKMKRVVRAWDRAASVVTPENKNPDWTVGIKIGEGIDDFIYIMGMERVRAKSSDVEKLTITTARVDGVGVKIKIFQDPGSAGVHEINTYTKLLKGFEVEIEKISKDKVTAARPFSSQCQVGNVKVLKADWNDDFFDELKTFPFGAHDDIVDAASSGYNCLMSSNVGTFGKSFLPQSNSNPNLGDMSW